MISTMFPCRAIAHALRNDALFNDVAQQHFGKGWNILIGFDGQKTDWERMAPCAVIAPWESEGKGVARSYSISLTLAVVDDQIVEADGVRTMHGLAVLDEEAWPAAWSALQDALPGLEPMAALQEPSLAITQEYAPLLMHIAGLAREINLPVGDRRL